MIFGPLVVLCLMILASVRPVMRVQAPVPHLLIVCSGVFVCGLTAWILASYTAQKLRAMPDAISESVPETSTLAFRIHTGNFRLDNVSDQMATYHSNKLDVERHDLV